MSVNQEIRDLLASYNTPAEISAQIADAFVRIDREGVAPGLAVGETAPDFELFNQHGEKVRLSDRLARGPVVLSFFRGSWCPVCNLQIAALNRALPEIEAAGASLIAVHPDSENFSPTPPLDFDALRDVDQAVIDSYRLRFTMPAKIRELYVGTLDFDISRHNADGSWSLPVPGTFVIDTNGAVRKRHVTADYTQRMEPEDVMAALRELATPAAQT